jgi:hypothetical protein
MSGVRRFVHLEQLTDILGRKPDIFLTFRFVIPIVSNR